MTSFIPRPPVLSDEVIIISGAIDRCDTTFAANVPVPTNTYRICIVYRYNGGMEKIGTILKGFDPTSGKYVSRQYQAYGLMLAQKLEDDLHKSLYIKMARETPQYILEKALSFVTDAKARNRARLFMWKVGELKKQYGNR